VQNTLMEVPHPRPQYRGFVYYLRDDDDPGLERPMPAAGAVPFEKIESLSNLVRVSGAGRQGPTHEGIATHASDRLLRPEPAQGSLQVGETVSIIVPLPRGP